MKVIKIRKIYFYTDLKAKRRDILMAQTTKMQAGSQGLRGIQAFAPTPCLKVILNPVYLEALNWPLGELQV